MEFKAKRKKDIHLDITPIVDTVFNLLIFFAVTLNFTTSPASLLLKLPEVDSRKYPLEASLPAISVSDRGDIRLNDQTIPLEELPSRLNALHAARSSGKILIRADARVDHGTVVTVMDMCQSSGFHAISIAAHPRNR
jgi:biopolymer transport protein ExbD